MYVSDLITDLAVVTIWPPLGPRIKSVFVKLHFSTVLLPYLLVTKQKSPNKEKYLFLYHMFWKSENYQSFLYHNQNFRKLRIHQNFKGKECPMSYVLCPISKPMSNVQCLREAFERYLIVSNDKGHKSYGPKIVITVS